jgi:hypothetical protein
MLINEQNDVVLPYESHNNNRSHPIWVMEGEGEIHWLVCQSRYTGEV